MAGRFILSIWMALTISSPGAAELWADQPNALTAGEIRDGWILLFDGESLFGWQASSQVDWRVENEAITASSGTRGLLHTPVDFRDFLLSVEFLAEESTNSGIFLRTSPECADPGPEGQCYELNIAPPGNPFPTGSLVQRARVGGAEVSGTWRRFEILVLGSRVEARLDNTRVLAYTDPNPLPAGKIGLQFNEGRVAFRSIKLKPVLLEPLFNGRDLSGWTVYPGKASQFSVTDGGELSILNGPGQIETIGEFDDFVLQLQVKCNGKGLNSGVFFRSIPGEWWQGYESQIHNGFKDGDRTSPADFGTGGIYRRVPARRIVADDGEWFSKTLVASGPNLAVWVNGYPVTSWTDTREPDSNPRQGRKLEAGTIILQGHDPTTDLLFRSMRIGPLFPEGRSR